MTFTVAELQLLVEALTTAGSRWDTYARCGKRSAHKKHADKAERAQSLRHRLSSFRARHHIVELRP